MPRAYRTRNHSAAARSHPYASAAHTPRPTSPARSSPAANPGPDPPATDPTQAFPFLRLPSELRDRIYALAAADTHTVILAPTGRLIRSTNGHALERASRRLRAEFLAHLGLAHAARTLVAVVRDFRFARLARHLRARPHPGLRRVVVRHEVTRAEVDAEALAAWGRFVGRETPAPGWAASTRHVVVGLPAVGQRRALMAQLLCLKRHVRDVLPEVERVVSGFEAQWRRGEGEFDFTGEERRERGAFDGVGR